MDVNHDQATKALASTGIEASELHGYLCGVYCQGIDRGSASWLTSIQDFLPDYESNQLLVEQLWQQIDTSLGSADMTFDLFLPGDEASVDRRASSLSDWCSGFVSGYGLGGTSGFRQSEGIREVLADFQSISRLNEEIEESEENEGDLVELEEYVRMGTILLYIEMPGEQEHS